MGHRAKGEVIELFRVFTKRLKDLGYEMEHGYDFCSILFKVGTLTKVAESYGDCNDFEWLTTPEEITKTSTSMLNAADLKRGKPSEKKC